MDCLHNTNSDICNGIITGAAGGFVAGIAIWGVNLLREKCLFKRDTKTVWGYLSDVIRVNSKDKWKSVKNIASHTNLTHDRVTYICSKHPKIKESVGPKDGMWGIKGISPDNQTQTLSNQQ